MDNTENKELFLSTFRKNVQRPGAEKLLAWMETTDFSLRPPRRAFMQHMRAACSIIR